jgi:hypothetical protein
VCKAENASMQSMVKPAACHIAARTPLPDPAGKPNDTVPMRKPIVSRNRERKREGERGTPR